MANTPAHAADDADEPLPDYPMPRAASCPFDPPPALRALQKKGPLTRVRLWDGSAPWLVTRYAEQRVLLADPRVSADVTQPGYPLQGPMGNENVSFIGMDGLEHARLRRMVTAPFTTKRVEAMRSTVQKIADELIDGMLAGPKPVDLVEAFALPVPSRMICELLGVPYTDRQFFQENGKVLITWDATPEQQAAAWGGLVEYLDGLLGVKLTNPGDDLVSGLAERVKNGELSRKEAVSMAVLLLVAGYETTANMIALGSLALLRHPDQLALLRETNDPKLIASAVEELLRYVHILHNGRRRAVLEDIEINGQVIRGGDGIIVPNEIGNRDPEVFPDPDRLDIQRDARGHLAFGYGVHQCLGQPLARLELQVVYSTLFRRIPTLRLATNLEQIPFKQVGFVYGVYELSVTW